MAMYGGRRDVSLLKFINKELMNKIIDTPVLYYKHVLDVKNENVYNESSDGAEYYTPIRINCHIVREEKMSEADELKQDYQINARFSFLRDKLVDVDLVCEVGDIIEWDNEFYEVDAVIENKYWTQKNPFTTLKDPAWGHTVSIICDAHVTRRSRINIIEKRSGIN